MSTQAKTDRLNYLTAHIDTMYYAITQHTEALNEARAERKAILETARTLTAADYRIVLCEDRDSTFYIDDMYGDAPTDDDSDEFKANYAADLACFERGEAWMYYVEAQKRDVESGEFETIDTCGGLYATSRTSRFDLHDMALDIGGDLLGLPSNIKLADIVVVSEEDL